MTGRWQLKRLLLVLAAGALLALMPATAVAQSITTAAGLVHPPQEVAQLRQQYEGLTLEQAKAAGYEPEGECVSNPMGAGAMGTHAINQQYLMAHFPKGEMDSAQPPVLLLDQNNKVMGVEWEAKDVGQGPMQLFGQTI